MKSLRSRLARMSGDGPLERRLWLVGSGTTLFILAPVFLALEYSLEQILVSLQAPLAASSGAGSQTLLRESINQVRAQLVISFIILMFLLLVVQNFAIRLLIRQGRLQ